MESAACPFNFVSHSVYILLLRIKSYSAQVRKTSPLVGHKQYDVVFGSTGFEGAENCSAHIAVNSIAFFGTQARGFPVEYRCIRERDWDSFACVTLETCILEKCRSNRAIPERKLLIGNAFSLLQLETDNLDVFARLQIGGIVGIELFDVKSVCE